MDGYQGRNGPGSASQAMARGAGSGQGDCQNIGLPLCGAAQTDADLHGGTFDALGSVVSQKGNPGETGEDQCFHLEAGAPQDQKAN